MDPALSHNGVLTLRPNQLLDTVLKVRSGRGTKTALSLWARPTHVAQAVHATDRLAMLH